MERCCGAGAAAGEQHPVKLHQALGPARGAEQSGCSQDRVPGSMCAGPVPVVPGRSSGPTPGASGSGAERWAARSSNCAENLGQQLLKLHFFGGF